MSGSFRGVGRLLTGTLSNVLNFMDDLRSNRIRSRASSRVMGMIFDSQRRKRDSKSMSTLALVKRYMMEHDDD